MRAILFVVGGFFLANIVFATFFASPARDAGKPAPVVNSATERGQDPWATNEKHIETGRKLARKSALDAMGQPFASFCTSDGHKRLIDALNYYYWQRATQLRGYPKTWGEAGGRYIVTAWAAPDDNRVERLTRETYNRGYFALDEFKSLTRDLIAGQVQGERVAAKPCAG